METTLYSSENAHTEKQPFWKKALYAWNQIRITFQGRIQNSQSWKSRTPGYDIGPFLYNPSNVWASNLCFSENFEDIHVMMYVWPPPWYDWLLLAVSRVSTLMYVGTHMFMYCRCTLQYAVWYWPANVISLDYQLVLNYSFVYNYTLICIIIRFRQSTIDKQPRSITALHFLC